MKKYRVCARGVYPESGKTNGYLIKETDTLIDTVHKDKWIFVSGGKFLDLVEADEIQLLTSSNESEDGFCVEPDDEELDALEELGNWCFDAYEVTNEEYFAGLPTFNGDALKASIFELYPTVVGTILGSYQGESGTVFILIVVGKNKYLKQFFKETQLGDDSIGDNNVNCIEISADDVVEEMGRNSIKFVLNADYLRSMGLENPQITMADGTVFEIDDFLKVVNREAKFVWHQAVEEIDTEKLENPYGSRVKYMEEF